MNKFIATLLIGLLGLTATAVINPVDQQRFVYQNLLANPGFENGSASWTASGGATKTANTTAKGTLSYGYDFDSNSATQTVSSETITIPNGLLGQNGVAFCGVKTPSGTATHNLEVFDGTNVIASVAVTTSSTRFANVITNFVFPTSGTVVLRLNAVASNEPEIYIDDCYIGLANNISTSTNVSDWVSFTPSITGAGVLSTVVFKYRRNGDSLEVEGTATAGTVTASTFDITIPNSLVIDTSKMNSTTNIQKVGDFYHATSGSTTIPSNSNGPFIVFYDGSTTNKLYVALATASQQYTKATGSNILSNSNPFTIMFRVPIQGWSAEPSFRPDLAAVSWSGYHDSTCAWARTNTAYGDPAADTTCALVERTNRNFGTVTSYLSGSDKLPGIVFTPPRTGRYYICAAWNYRNGTLAQNINARLWDGTTTIGETMAQEYVASNDIPGSICGILDIASTSSKTISLQTKTPSGTVTIGASGATSNVEWSVVAIDQGFPAPILLGSVTSKSTTAEGIERVTFGGATEGTNNCTGSPCTMYRNSAGISSVTRSATGIYVINFVSGAFSAPPTCVGNGIVIGTGIGTASQSTVTAPTSTTFNLNFKNSSSIDADGGNINVTCMGPK